MRIELDKDFQASFENKKNIFDQIMAIDGTHYRSLENRRTLSFVRQDKRYFIKQHFGIGWKEIFKNLLYLRLPVIGAKTEWNAIQKLHVLGLDTMQAVGYGYRGINPARIQSFLITRALEQVESLEDFCENWREYSPSLVLKKNIIEKLAQIAKTLHQNGVNHRDFYLCHFMLDHMALQKKELKLYLIDLHRTQIRKQTPERWKIKDISGLYFSSLHAGISKKDIFRFLKIYFDAPVRDILHNYASFLKKIERRAIKLHWKMFRKTPSVPYEIKTSGVNQNILSCKKILRSIPGKRVVVSGFWDKKIVLAKCFFSHFAQKKCQAELRGLKILTKLQIRTPKLLHYDKSLNMLLYEYISPDCHNNTIWLGKDVQKLKAFLLDIQSILSTLHQHGYWHRDPHPHNFIYHQGQLYLVDHAAIAGCGRSSGLSKRRSMVNLASVYAQLYAEHQPLIETAFQSYCDARQWRYGPKLKKQLARALYKARMARMKEIGTRCMRNCKETGVIKKSGRFVAYQRGALSEEDLQTLIKNPEQYIQSAHIIKAGNTCTVFHCHSALDAESRVAQSALIKSNSLDSRLPASQCFAEMSRENDRNAGTSNILIKRYNIKNMMHCIKICWRTSRAIKAWKNTHIANIFGIKTAAPIAVVVNRWGIFHGRAYFMMSYEQGALLDQVLDSDSPDKAIIAKNTVSLLNNLHAAYMTQSDTKATNFLIQGTMPLLLDLDALKIHRHKKSLERSYQKTFQRLLKNWKDAPQIQHLFLPFVQHEKSPIDMSIIIVNYNTADLVCDAVRSILQQQGVTYEVIVIDNASQDSSVTALEEFGDRITLIKSDENLGFGKANNRAFQKAQGQYVFLLNPDAHLQAPHDLKHIVAFMQAHPQFGLVSTRIMRGDVETKPNFCYPGEKHIASPLKNLPGSIAWVLGASMILPRHVFEDIRGFDEDFFLYGEDADICLRVRKAGYAIGYLSDVSILHVGGASESSTDAYALTLKKHKALALFYRKHYGLANAAFLLEHAKKRALRRLRWHRLLSKVGIRALSEKKQKHYQAIVDSDAGLSH